MDENWGAAAYLSMVECRRHQIVHDRQLSHSFRAMVLVRHAHSLHPISTDVTDIGLWELVEERWTRYPKIAAIAKVVNFTGVLMMPDQLPQFLMHCSRWYEVDKSVLWGLVIERKSHGWCVWVVDLVVHVSGTYAKCQSKMSWFSTSRRNSTSSR